MSALRQGVGTYIHTPFSRSLQPRMRGMYVYQERSPIREDLPGALPAKRFKQVARITTSRGDAVEIRREWIDAFGRYRNWEKPGGLDIITACACDRQKRTDIPLVRLH